MSCADRPGRLLDLVAYLSRNHSTSGERARHGRSGWRPRQPLSRAAETTHSTVTSREPRPPGEGAGWQRPRRARSPEAAASFRPRLILSGLVISLAMHPDSLRACTACYGQSDSPMAAGMNWGIMSLLVVVGSVLGGVA